MATRDFLQDHPTHNDTFSQLIRASIALSRSSKNKSIYSMCDGLNAVMETGKAKRKWIFDINFRHVCYGNQIGLFYFLNELNFSPTHHIIMCSPAYPDFLRLSLTGGFFPFNFNIIKHHPDCLFISFGRALLASIFVDAPNSRRTFFRVIFQRKM